MAEIKLTKRIKYAADVYKELIERAGFPLDLAADFLNNIPDADAVPVVHGRWVKSDIPHEKYCCSACGGACWYYDYEGEVARSRYCPNCGANMDGGAEG